MAFSTIEELVTAVGADAVKALTEAGWVLPVQVCVSGADGCMASLRFEVEGQPPRILATHSEGSELPMLVILLFMSAAQQAALLVVEGDAVGDIAILR